MIVVDVEATGTESKVHSILSIGAIEFERPQNRFYEECRIFEGAHVMKEALLVNGYTEDQIRDQQKQTDGELVRKFLSWAEKCNEHTFAGQNPAFDREFIEASAKRNHLNWPFAHRSLDLHSLCYFHLVQQGREVPLKNRHSDVNSDFIMSYVGIPPEPQPHVALNGALFEAEAFSRLLYNRGLLPEFQKYTIPWIA